MGLRQKEEFGTRKTMVLALNFLGFPAMFPFNLAPHVLTVTVKQSSRCQERCEHVQHTAQKAKESAGNLPFCLEVQSLSEISQSSCSSMDGKVMRCLLVIAISGIASITSNAMHSSRRRSHRPTRRCWKTSGRENSSAAIEKHAYGIEELPYRSTMIYWSVDIC